MSHAPPGHPVAAVVHPNPSAYYAHLAALGRVVFDPETDLWIAACAEDVEAALAHPSLLVRPEREPIPRAISGSRAGAAFGKLARMSDGSAHVRRRALALERLASLRTASFDSAMRRCRADTTSIDEYIDRAGTYALLYGFGFEESDYATLFEHARNWIAAFAPNPPAEVVTTAATTAASLFSSVAARLESDDEEVVSNAMGLLFQTYDASRATIGNAFRRLLETTDRNGDRRAGEPSIERIVETTFHEDTPIQNTRRYARESLAIRGVTIPQDAIVLIVLAAANRQRTVDTTLQFGSGDHACPGRALAKSIAVAALRGLLIRWYDRGGDAGDPIAYLPSHNARIPRFNR